MKLTKIYIGSNNATKELEVLKIIEVLNNLGNCGYTLVTGNGYYNSIEERTAIIEIYGDYNTGIIPELKRVLKQKSLLVAEFIAEVQFYD